MLTAVSDSFTSTSTNTIGHLVLKSPRAHVLQSQGDGFGAYIERLINAAHETHRSFKDLLPNCHSLIQHLRKELERTYSQYQFSIIIGKDFDFDQQGANPFAFIEHTGMKFLVFSSIGPSYKHTTTTSNDLADDQTPMSW